MLAVTYWTYPGCNEHTHSVLTATWYLITPSTAQNLDNCTGLTETGGKVRIWYLLPSECMTFNCDHGPSVNLGRPKGADYTDGHHTNSSCYRAYHRRKHRKELYQHLMTSCKQCSQMRLSCDPLPKEFVIGMSGILTAFVQWLWLDFELLLKRHYSTKSF